MKRHHILFLAAGLLALPAVSLAGACASESVATLVAGSGTTCSIDGVTFDFYNYAGTSDGATTTGFQSNEVTFAPSSTGFNLSGDFSSSGSSTQGYGTLYYNILSVSNSGTVTGATVSVNNSSGSISRDYSGKAQTSASTFLWPGGTATANLTETEDSGSYSGTVTGSASSGASFGGISSSLFDYAQISTYASSEDAFCHFGGCSQYPGGTATASFTSASFGFNVTPDPPPSMPEPSAWLSLLAMGGLAIIPVRRLRRRG